MPQIMEGCPRGEIGGSCGSVPCLAERAAAKRVAEEVAENQALGSGLQPRRVHGQRVGDDLRERHGPEAGLALGWPEVRNSIEGEVEGPLSIDLPIELPGLLRPAGDPSHRARYRPSDRLSTIAYLRRPFQSSKVLSIEDYRRPSISNEMTPSSTRKSRSELVEAKSGELATVSRPVGGILSGGPSPGTACVAIHLMRSTRGVPADRRDGRSIPSARPCSGWGLPSRPGHPGRWCALTAPFHPYLCSR